MNTILNQSKYICRLVRLGLLLGMIFSILPSGHADLGETRDQIVARYGKPYEETKNDLHFQLKDGGVLVILGSDGRSVEECYGYIEDAGQKRVMEILKRNSKGLDWSPYRLYSESPQTEWRYRQPELGMRAIYENEEARHDSVYYSLVIEFRPKH